MFGFKFLGNTHIPHRKNTADMPPVQMTPPSEVLLPMLQHIGAPCEPVVAVGDEVKVGQLVGAASGYVSANIYSSVSGKVIKIEDYLRPDGKTVKAVRIKSDGLMTEAEGLHPREITDLDSLVEAAKSCGLVGLGGAGFPTAVKLDGAKKNKIDTLILNGAECEPYITSDTRTMLDEAEIIKEGVKLLRTALPDLERLIIGIEKNKPACIAKMKETFSDDESASVKPLPSLYPQGGEKVLIHNVAKRTVPEGKLPADVGVLVINVTTLTALTKFIKTGMPLVSKTVTVDGSAVAEPKNLIVPVGTPVKDILEFAGGLKSDPVKVLSGGPMMGFPFCTLDEPIIKTTGAITAMTEKESAPLRTTACIHCGRCVTACPMNLNPTAFSAALDCANEAERISIFDEGKVYLCIDCGCCSYVCPAKRPLVENNRMAKAELKAYKSRSAELKN